MVSANCMELVKHFEGCQLRAYQCPAGVWTIGYGHTGLVDGVPVAKGMTITQQKADELLEQDLEQFREHVMSYQRIYHWNRNEVDALVSFAFNVGNIHQLTAYGTRSREVIAQKMLLYTKANNAILPGLIRRREAEAELFCRKVAPSGAPEPVEMNVQGEPVTVSRILHEGTNYVHLRELCNALGVGVSYHGGEIWIG